jgi:hypothetical protein
MATLATKSQGNEEHSENPYEPCNSNDPIDPFARIATSLREEIAKQLLSYPTLVTDHSPIFSEEWGSGDNKLLSSLAMYAARSQRNKAYRRDEFDALLLGEQNTTLNEQYRLGLFEEHGDILKRANEYSNLMFFWSGTTILSSIITFSGASGAIVFSPSSNIADRSSNLLEYAMYCWLTSGIGMLGSAVGAWSCLNTMWKADDPQTLTTDTLEYLGYLQNRG